MIQHVGIWYSFSHLITRLLITRDEHLVYHDLVMPDLGVRLDSRQLAYGSEINVFLRVE